MRQRLPLILPVIALSALSVFSSTIPVIFITLPVAPAIASTPVLSGWRNTRWGMSIDEVKKLYPFTDGMEQAEDGIHTVGKTKATIDGNRYDVRFVFLMGYGLESVNLAWKPTTGDSVNPVSVVASKLQARYGMPSRNDSSRLGLFTDLTWSLAASTLKLWGNNELILIRYGRLEPSEF